MHTLNIWSHGFALKAYVEGAMNGQHMMPQTLVFPRAQGVRRPALILAVTYILYHTFSRTCIDKMTLDPKLNALYMIPLMVLLHYSIATAGG